MHPRAKILALVGGLLAVILACGSEAPAGSPTRIPSLRYEKDEIKATSGEQSRPTEVATTVPPPQITDFDFTDAQHGWLAFGNSVGSDIMATADGGRTWTELSKTPFGITSLDFISTNQGWIHSGSGLYMTTDGGGTWELVNSADLPDNARVRFTAAAHGWAAASYNDAPHRAIGDSRVFASSDGGHTWTRVDTPCGGSWALAVSPLDANSASLACGDQPATAMEGKQLYRTVDGGQNWELVSADTMPWGGHLTGIFSLDESHSWMSTSRGGLYSTDDSGVSWQFLPTGVDCGEEFVSNPQLLSRDIGFVLAAKCSALVRLLGTQDGGISWSSLYPPPSVERCSTPESREKPDVCGDSPYQ